MGKINVKAKQTRMKIGSKPELFLMNTEATYSNIPGDEVMREVSKKLNQPQAVIRECLACIPEIIESHACNGHTVTIPYVGTFRFGFTSEAVENVEDVSKNLIKSKRLVYVPTKDIKRMLGETRISITCYDLQGNVIKRVIDTDTEVDTGEEQNQQGEQTQNPGEQTQQPGNTNTNPTPSSDKVTVKWLDTFNQEKKSMEVAVGGSIQQSDFPAATGSNSWDKNLAQINAELASASAGSTITVKEQGDGF